MKKALVYNFGVQCGILEEVTPKRKYIFRYNEGYKGNPVSLTMPVTDAEYCYDEFPPFFDGLLPEGFNLDAMCRSLKIDKEDAFGQLLASGRDVVGSVSVEPYDE
jgi:serine/threonine-protein kinase HipA